MNFKLSTYSEICEVIGKRLNTQRISQSLTQIELAKRAGVSTGTIKNIENNGQVSLESIIRVVIVLGLVDELEPLFKLNIKSIAQMEKSEITRRRVRHKKSKIK
ncbi:MAG: helix-turn-helix transcriptional regulator [Pseudomonadota bacterium]